MYFKYSVIKFESAFQRWDKIEGLFSSPHVVYTARKQVISRRGKGVNVYEAYI